MKILTTAAGLIALLGAVAAGPQDASPQPATKVAHIRFFDRGGNSVTDLRPDEIQIFDTGVEQPLVQVLGPELPFDVGLLLDVSPSVESYVGVIRDETHRFFYSLPDAAPAMILTFDDEVYVDADWTLDRKEIDEAIYEIGLNKPGSSSIIYEALSLTLELKYGEQPRQVLIFFTDGWETGSKNVSDEQSIQQLRDSNVLTFVLQYDSRQHYRKIYYGPVRARGYDPSRNPVPPTTGGTRIGGIMVGGGELDQAEYKVQYGHERATKYLMRAAGAGRTKLQTLELSGRNLGKIYDGILAELSDVYTVTFRPLQQHPQSHQRPLIVKTSRPGVTPRLVTSGYWP